MKRLVKSIVLSAAVAAATLVPVLEASAGERWREHRPRHPGLHNRDDARGDMLAAGILGLAIGAVAASVASQNTSTYVETYPDTGYFPPAPGGGYDDGYYAYAGSVEPWSNGWYEYCTARYRSFDPRSGTFTGYDGLQHFCVAP